MAREDPVNSLREAVAAARIRKGISQRELAQQLGMAPSTLSNLLKGETTRTTRETLRRLRDIEEILDLDAGELSSRLGVAKPGSARAAILQDPSLSPEVRDALGVILTALVGSSVTDIGTRRPSKTPRAAAAEGGKPATSRKKSAEMAQHVERRKPKVKRDSPRNQPGA